MHSDFVPHVAIVVGSAAADETKMISLKTLDVVP